jgi:sulfate adenylyltransferase
MRESPRAIGAVVPKGANATQREMGRAMGDEPATPHGGLLVQLVAESERARELLKQSLEWPSWELTPRQLCDLELLMCGGFSPLRGFMNRTEYESVCTAMRLPQGLLWPIPVTLDVPDAVVARIEKSDGRLALRDLEGGLLAVLHAQDVFRPDPRLEAELVLASTNPDHPGVRHLEERTQPWRVGGAVEGVRLPVHHDFQHLRHSPAELRARFAAQGWRRVVAFQTRNPMHRAHQELTLRAATDANANLLVHPVVGTTKPGDVDHYTRVRCYEAIMPTYPADMAMLSLLPLAMRMAGPREALWHAIIRKNYGATHLIVGRDHAGPGLDRDDQPFYPPYAAQDLLRRYQGELGVTMLPFRQMVYVEDLDRYVPEDEVSVGRTRSISGTEQRRYLAEGRSLPEWFTPPAVATELRRTYPPRSQQGFAVFLTGLPAAGKSTIANVLLVKLLEQGGRRVTLLDGDLVRKHLSAGLGFSRADRDANIRRIGFVAAEIGANGGVAICAAIAPYDETRKQVRAMVAREAGFLLVHVATPISVCEARDRKGLYAKAHAGLLNEFTGVSDPYEAPDDAEVVVDSSVLSAEQAADRILGYLKAQGYLAR